ncbi:MAG: LysR family transcriptional regulator [Bordetella sp.]|nr:LysR family transcriptional regulator [Bordetella sp.]
MEIRQLQFFVRVVELKSMGRAALELGVVTSTLSQQISRLEGELSTRLLQRTSTGVVPTGAGLEFWRHAKLILRHVDIAAVVAHEGRLSGQVSVGMSATTASVLAIPFAQEMRERYPSIQLHLVEGLSGHLATLLNGRQLDLAIIFDAQMMTRCSSAPLLHERLFVVGSRTLRGMPVGEPAPFSVLQDLPMILPSRSHTLRGLVLQGFERARIEPRVVSEVDGMAIIIDMMIAGMGATILPGSAMSRLQHENLAVTPLEDPQMQRTSLLTSLSDDELSPAALAARVVLSNVSRRLVVDGLWLGARVSD